MRYNQFKTTLLEYRRDKTAATFGDKLLNRIGTSSSNSLPDFLYTVHTLIALIKHPEKFSHWGTSSKTVPLLGKYISVSIANATEILNKYKPAIIDATLDAIESGDPTTNKLYTPWLTREFIKSNIRSLEDIGSRFTPLLSDYERYKKQRAFPAEGKDIMRLTATEFADIMGSYSPPEEEIKNRGQAKTVYDDANVRVIVPEDEAAACFYGQGTRWCTASTHGSNMFSHYNKQGRLYIILPKKPNYTGEKYQLHFPSGQFMDPQDDPHDLSHILGKRFPELKEFFIEHEPGIKDMIEFADDETLSEFSKLIGPWISDRAFDLAGDWESNDDDYHRWQVEQAKERGYVDEEGDVDWDQVFNDDELNNYGDYNDEVGDFYKNVNKIYNLSPQEIKSYANELWEDGDSDGTVTMSDLDNVYAKAIEDIFNVGRGSSGDAGLADIVSRKLWVRAASDYSGSTDSYGVLGKVGKWTVGYSKSK